MIPDAARSTFEPAYLALHRSGELARRARAALETLHGCYLCGRLCGIDRAAEAAPCGVGLDFRVATAYLHLGEEPPLVAGGGSGAVFFSGCELRCQFCQTYRWNIRGRGWPADAQSLAGLMLDLQRRGAANINLVTPTHVLPQIMGALVMAAEEGLHLPLVWNSGGYDAPQALALLDGVVDIYLPDMKYADAALGYRLSRVRDYPQVNRAAVREMVRQAGHLVTGADGAAKRGLIIRHLVMPGCGENTAGVLRWIAENLGAGATLSLMGQYRPAYRAFGRADVGRALTTDEFDEAKRLAESLGIRYLDASATLLGQSLQA